MSPEITSSIKLIDKINAQVWDCFATYRPAGAFNACNHVHHRLNKRVLNFLLLHSLIKESSFKISQELSQSLYYSVSTRNL